MTSIPKPARKINRELLKTMHVKSCVICGRTPCDPCHITTRGSGGPDEDYNVINMCRLHHIEQGQIGWYKFSNKYPSIKLELRRRGWVFADLGGVHKLKRLEMLS